MTEGPSGRARRAGKPRPLDEARREIAELRERVEQLERDMNESRQLSKRLAEITDVVAEVLLPAEQRDEQRMHELLARYNSAL